MPYVSDQQRRWAHTSAGTKALGGPSAVAEWDSASKGLRLPKRITGKPRKPQLPKSAGHIVFGSLAPDGGDE